MSQPGDESMDCEDAVEHLYTYLDGELTPEVEAAVRAHLKKCQDCSGHFHFEREFLRFLEARARAQEAPGHLRKRLFRQILLEHEDD